MSNSNSSRNGTFRRVFTLGMGIVAGILLSRIFRYFARLFRQPPLLVVKSRENIVPELEKEAYEIASANLLSGLEVRTLENGISRTVLCAGVRNFREPWARDTGFALFGLMELGAYREVKEAIEIFLLTQHPSGQLPVKIHSTSIIDRFMHSMFNRQQPVDQPIRPKYITAHNTISLDGNALLVIAALNYGNRMGDAGFITENWDALDRAMQWLESHKDQDVPLLKQGAFTDWADSISRSGKILYTNVIYWKALQEMGLAAKSLDYHEEADQYLKKAADLSKYINEEFWREDLGYYVTSRYFENLSSSGNLLAIAWGLATDEQSHRILDAMRFYGMAIPVPTKVVHRAYPKKFIAIENRLGGIANYHTYFAWLWLGAWHAIALARLGRFDEAGEVLYNMSRVIVRDGAVHEVYAPNGSYASNLWYTSESPLTWSAGMFVYAYNVYHRLLEEAETE